MKKKYSEKYLEKKLREEVKKLGGIALKFQSSSFTGMPDRIILLPGSAVMWIELKSEDKKPNKEQQTRIKMLEKMEHMVYVVDDLTGLEKVLADIQEYIEASAEIDERLEFLSRALPIIEGAAEGGNVQ